MENVKTEKVMDRKKVADSIHGILEVGVNILKKKTSVTRDDHSKIKLIRVMGPHVSAGVAMVQQETAQQRLEIVQERMKQLGYGENPQLEK